MQGLGIVVWAFAKLGCDAACPAVMRLLGEFAAEALRRLEHPGGDPTMQLGAQSLSNLVRPNPNPRCKPHIRLLGEFAAEALCRLEHPGGNPTMQLGAQSLSNLVRLILTLEPEALLWVCS